ncbi:hypothetical protein [Akkermansia sp.]|uniref:hypothetical protein n=1 Tax=Akkermansia sp. TaxID=1872421 RepID=UPI003A8E8560
MTTRDDPSSHQSILQPGVSNTSHLSIISHFLPNPSSWGKNTHLLREPFTASPICGFSFISSALIASRKGDKEGSSPITEEHKPNPPATAANDSRERNFIIEYVGVLTQIL